MDDIFKQIAATSMLVALEAALELYNDEDGENFGAWLKQAGAVVNLAHAAGLSTKPLLKSPAANAFDVVS